MIGGPSTSGFPARRKQGNADRRKSEGRRSCGCTRGHKSLSSENTKVTFGRLPLCTKSGLFYLSVFTILLICVYCLFGTVDTITQCVLHIFFVCSRLYAKILQYIGDALS